MNDTVIGKSDKMAHAAIHPAPAQGRSFMTRIRARRGKGESGQSLVEFALVLPVILLVLAGIMELGIIMNQYQILTYATGVGARAFALSRGQSSYSPYSATDPCEYAYDVAVAAMPSINTSNLQMTIVYTPPGGSTKTWSGVTGTSGCASESLGTADINGTVTVQVTYSATPPVFFGIKALTANLSASGSEQIQ
jgi:Flp pilus assembly protein TadG